MRGENIVLKGDKATLFAEILLVSVPANTTFKRLCGRGCASDKGESGGTCSRVGTLHADGTTNGRRGGRRPRGCSARRRKRGTGSAVLVGAKGRELPRRLGRMGREGIDGNKRFGGGSMQGVTQVVGGKSARWRVDASVARSAGSG
jgi:hypothetical protein